MECQKQNLTFLTFVFKYVKILMAEQILRFRKEKSIIEIKTSIEIVVR